MSEKFNPLPPQVAEEHPDINWGDDIGGLELSVSTAAADLELGRKKDEEIEDYQEVYDQYKDVVEGKTSDRLKELLGAGVSGEDAKYDLVQQLIHAKANLLHKTRRIEVEESMNERGLEWLASKPVVRSLGGIAIAAVITKIGGTMDSAIQSVQYVGAAVSLAGGAGAMKAMSKFAGKEVRSKIGEGKLTKDERTELKGIKDREQKRDRQIEMQHDHHLVRLEERMLAQSARMRLDDDKAIDTYVQTMLGMMEESVDEVFGAEKKFSKGALTAAVKKAIEDRFGAAVGKVDSTGVSTEASGDVSSEVYDAASERVIDIRDRVEQRRAERARERDDELIGAAGS